MNILFLTDGIYPFTIGGMQKHSSEMVKGLLKKDISVTLVFCVDFDQSLPSNEVVINKLGIQKSHTEKLKLIGLKFPSPGRLPGHYIRNSYTYSKNIFELVKNQLFEFDFIYAQGYSGWYLMENNLPRPKIGVNFHGLNMFQLVIGIKNNLIARMFRPSVKKNLKMADFVFTFGGIFNTIYNQIGVADKLIFQPIGIDVSKISEDPKNIGNKLRFVFIGRNDRVKGLDILNQSIQSIPEEKFQFEFIGEYPEHRQLKRKDCIYTGLLTENLVEKELLNADVLVCPSLSEGMPFVILEAMAKGLIIIATKVGAVSELVDESNGLLIKPGDSELLFNAIIKVGNWENSKLMKMKINSIEKSSKFDWKKIIDQFLVDINNKMVK